MNPLVFKWISGSLGLEVADRGCGACVPVCPVSAIFAPDDLPEKWKHFTEMNAKHSGR